MGQLEIYWKDKNLENRDPSVSLLWRVKILSYQPILDGYLRTFLYLTLLCNVTFGCTAIKSPGTIGIDYKYIPIYSNIEFTRDGKNLLFGDTTGRVIIWDLASNRAVNQLEGDHLSWST